MSAVSSLIKVRDFITANKFIKMLKLKDTLLSFLRIDDISKAVLFCFSDAPFANLKWGGSHVGVLVFLKWNDRRYMLLACPEN